MLAKKLSDLVKVYDDLLSADKCNKIVEFFENHSTITSSKT